MVCPLDTAAITELWRLDFFLALLLRSFVLVRCLREANVAIFAEELIGVDKHLFQRVSLITFMTLPLNYIFVLLLASVNVIPKQNQLSTV